MLSVSNGGTWMLQLCVGAKADSHCDTVSHAMLLAFDGTAAAADCSAINETVFPKLHIMLHHCDDVESWL